MATCIVMELPPPPPVPPEPDVDMPLDDVPPPQETSPAASVTVNIMSRSPRKRTAALLSRRRPTTSMVMVISRRAVRAVLHARGRLYAGRLREDGAERNMLLVGVPTREIFRVSVLLWVGSRGCGLKVQVSQLGRAAPVSALMQEKVIGPGKPAWLTVTVKFADAFDAERLAELGEIEPVGKVAVAKSISAIALPLA